MSQAKGVLPRREDRNVLYKNPATCGYFVGVHLDPAIDRARAEAWFRGVTTFVDELVSHAEKRVAAVAVGLAPSFFTLGGVPRFEPAITPPAAFRPDAFAPLPNTMPPLSGAAVLRADVLFYVASVLEERVSRFIERLWSTRPDVQGIELERGYQREDESEPFGYRDGLRNAHGVDRSEVVFVHRDLREIEEPEWAEAGTYMAFAKILQNRDAFMALAGDEERDLVIGRTKPGERLDLVGQGVNPKDEPAEPVPALPPSAHVGKAGPRGRHDDNEIFRRGLPFVEVSGDGQLQVGLQFCSFQASLDQFDVVFNDWMANTRFPVDGAGLDAIFDPARGFTTVEKVGFYFVPPHDAEFLAAGLFRVEKPERKARLGRLVIRKRVVDPSDASRRFERGGFVFQVLDEQRQPVGGQFITNSAGRAVAPERLELGKSYIIQEVASNGLNVQPLGDIQLIMERSHQELRVVNQVLQPNSPYGG
jgi:Dyp-type peroxidase family